MKIVKKIALAILVGLLITNLTAFKVSHRRYSSCAPMVGGLCTENQGTWEYRGVPEYLSRVREPAAFPNATLDVGYELDIDKYLRGVFLWSSVVIVLGGLSELEKKLRTRAKKGKG